MVCHRPEGLDQLEAQTNFSKRELQELYRGFKNVHVAHTITKCTKFYVIIHLMNMQFRKKMGFLCLLK